MNIPENLYYTKEHEWLKVNGNEGIVGVTDFAQHQLGDIVFIEVNTVGEIYDQYGPGIALGRQITEKLSSSLSYQVYWRGSNEQDRNYTVNIVSLNLSYAF